MSGKKVKFDPEDSEDIHNLEDRSESTVIKEASLYASRRSRNFDDDQS